MEEAAQTDTCNSLVKEIDSAISRKRKILIHKYSMWSGDVYSLKRQMREGGGGIRYSRSEKGVS